MLFGAHESISGGVDKAIERGKMATCDTIQMFNKSNSQWRAAPLRSDVVDRYFKNQEELGVSVATSHSSYLINIASPDRALSVRSFNSLKEEMERCNLLKIPNLVMHPGAHVGSGEAAGLDRVVENINSLFDELPNNQCTLLLEATAGMGSTLGYKFEHLAYMIDRIDDKAHIGVCIDTCHIYAAGYNIADPKEYKKVIKSFDDTVGLDKLKIIHMNDSKMPLGSNRDRHEHIGKGTIGLQGFRNIVNDRRLKKIPMILETPKEDDLKADVRNLKVLRGLVKKKTSRSKK